MLDVQEIAIEAVNARYDKSPFYGAFLLELEAAGCSRAKIAALRERASAVVPNPHAPRALRVLKQAAKSARRGDELRMRRLHELAGELVGLDEVAVLTEEHRLCFTVRAPTPVVSQRASCGFAV